MNDRTTSEIAGRIQPSFIEIKLESRSKLRRTNDWIFIEISRQRGGGRVPFTEAELAAIDGLGSC